MSNRYAQVMVKDMHKQDRSSAIAGLRESLGARRSFEVGHRDKERSDRNAQATTD